MGNLGLFSAKGPAKPKRTEWLFEELSSLNDELLLALSYGVSGEFLDRPLPGARRRTERVGDKYTILDMVSFHDRYENDYEDFSQSVTLE